MAFTLSSSSFINAALPLSLSQVYRVTATGCSFTFPSNASVGLAMARPSLSGCTLSGSGSGVGLVASGSLDMTGCTITNVDTVLTLSSTVESATVSRSNLLSNIMASAAPPHVVINLSPYAAQLGGNSFPSRFTAATGTDAFTGAPVYALSAFIYDVYRDVSLGEVFFLPFATAALPSPPNAPSPPLQPSPAPTACNGIEYTSIDDSSRDIEAPGGCRCDAALPPGWYRFFQEGRDAYLPEWAVVADGHAPNGICGTDRGGFIAYSLTFGGPNSGGGLGHPAVSEGIARRTLIFEFGVVQGNNYAIDVVNCSSFFLYNFITPSAWCRDWGGACSGGSAAFGLCTTTQAPPPNADGYPAAR
jgi:hypothetical protein